jgi:perosamine synthetase
VIPFHRPSITEDEISAVTEVLRSGWLTTGNVTHELEARFAERTAKHAIAVNSATAALHLALEALGIGPGDEVVVPTYTFAACGAVVQHLGATVVLSDVGEDYLLGSEQLASVLSHRTKAVIPVHFAGQVADIDSLIQVDPSLAIIEDAAHSLPSKLVGDAAAYSFYATKTMTTGEGGMLVTDSDEIANRAKRMRLHGIDADAWNRYGPGNRWSYAIEDAGFKYNLSDIASAIGLVQLRRSDEMRHKRARIADRYDEAFNRIISIPPRSESWHLYVIQVDDRDKVIERLASKGIGASVHFIPLHLHPHYQRMGYRTGQFPVAERLYSRSLSLPIWPDMTQEQVDCVASAVIEAVT